MIDPSPSQACGLGPSLSRERERGFGEAAVRLCGAAAQVLGWRPGEFWEATPAELAAVLGRFAPCADVPDTAMIEELRRRFPDE
jgi:uncharacterized phage protein (TIGR02216 family)